MFEHLDDPAPFRPGPELRRRVVARGRRLRLRRRLAATAGATTLALGGVTFAGVAYVDHRDDAIDRVDIATAPSLDHAVNVLLVGTDARPAAAAGARADTVVLARFRPDGRVTLLAIPRDLRVPGTDRVVSAVATEGTQALVDAVSTGLGLPVDHVIVVGLDGFMRAVDDAGGLRLAVDVPLHDTHAGLDLQPSACTTLDGEAALALVRARHVEGDTQGDLSRIARMRAVMQAAVAQLAATGADPLAIDRLAGVLADDAVLSSGLSLGELVDLGRHLAAAGPEGVTGIGLPVTVDPAQPSRLVLAAEADAVLRDHGATTPPVAEGGPAPSGTPPVGESGAVVGIRPC